MRCFNAVKAEGAFARLAIEMDVIVMVMTFSLFSAQLIIDDAASVLKRMHHIVFDEERQSTEYARLVHVEHFGLEIL